MPRQLSARETEVLRLLGKGRTTGEIAEVLGISEATVVWYVSRAVTTLGPRRTDELATSLAREATRRALAIALISLVLLVVAGAVVSSTGVAQRMDIAFPPLPHVPSSSTPSPPAPTRTAPGAQATAAPIATVGPLPTLPPLPVPIPSAPLPTLAVPLTTPSAPRVP